MMAAQFRRALSLDTYAGDTLLAGRAGNQNVRPSAVARNRYFYAVTFAMVTYWDLRTRLRIECFSLLRSSSGPDAFDRDRFDCASNSAFFEKTIEAPSGVISCSAFLRYSLHFNAAPANASSPGFAFW
jgi:hypothetical protein